MTARRLAAIVFACALAPAGEVLACAFCGTGKGAAGPGQSMALADRTVLAAVVGRKLVFGEDAVARSTAVFEVIRTHGGDSPAPGRRFESVSPRGVLGEAKRAVLMLALDKDKPEKITLLDAFPDPEGRLFDYLTAAADVPKLDFARRIAFFVQHLESDHPDIADDARSRFLDIPNKALREHKDKLPADKLRAWLRSEKTAPMRKGLYGLMLGLAGKTQDVDVLRAALPSVAENVIGSGGVLAGLCVLTGRPDEVLGAVFGDVKRPTELREGAVGVVRFLWEEAEPEKRADIRRLFAAALKDRDAAPAAITELALIGEFSLTEEIKAYWLDPARRGAKGRIAIFRYRDSLPKEEREAFRRFLSANPQG
jgi:hypothetical protein